MNCSGIKDYHRNTWWFVDMKYGEVWQAYMTIAIGISMDDNSVYIRNSQDWIYRVLKCIVSRSTEKLLHRQKMTVWVFTYYIMNFKWIIMLLNVMKPGPLIKRHWVLHYIWQAPQRFSWHLIFADANKATPLCGAIPKKYHVCHYRHPHPRIYNFINKKFGSSPSIEKRAFTGAKLL